MNNSPPAGVSACANGYTRVPMQHFLVEITYTAPPLRMAELVSAHRAFLQQGYDSGLLLLSGPQHSRQGGVVLARAADEAMLRAFFAQDPYVLAGAADYRYVGFDPVKHQPFLSDWLTGEV